MVDNGTNCYTKFQNFQFQFCFSFFIFIQSFFSISIHLGMIIAFQFKRFTKLTLTVQCFSSDTDLYWVQKIYQLFCPANHPICKFTLSWYSYFSILWQLLCRDTIHGIACFNSPSKMSKAFRFSCSAVFVEV